MKKNIAIVCLLLILQGVFTLSIFPYYKIDLTSPLLQIDYAVHHYQTIQTLEFLKESGRVWGYDPYYMAGYPTPFFNLLDHVGASIVVGILSVIMPLAVGLKLFVFFNLLLLPVLIYYACRNFSFSSARSFASALMLIIMLNSFWFYRSLIEWGLYNFVFGSFFALLTFSYLYGYLQSGSFRKLLAYTLAGVWTLLLHPLAAIVLAGLVGSFYVVSRRAFTLSKIKFVLLGSLLIVIVNLIWAAPLLRFSQFYVPRHFGMQALGVDAFRSDIFNFIKILFSLMLLFSLMAPFVIKRDERHCPLIWSLWGLALLSYCVAYFSVGPLKAALANIEPARFLIVTMILAAVLAPQVFIILFRRKMRLVVGFLSAILFIQLGFLFIKAIGKGSCPFSREGYFFCRNIMNPINPRDVMNNSGGRIIKGIKDLTNTDGRILAEDTKYPNAAYDYSYLLAVMAHFTGREFIGGPYNTIKMQHHFVSFCEGQVFGRPINSIDIDAFIEYMDLYNVKWVLAHSKEAKEYFQKHERYFKEIKRFNDIVLYVVMRDTSFFIKGSGKITASLDKIVIQEASQGEIVIKYHYADFLNCQQGTIKKYSAMDDPIGFILIDNANGFDLIEIEH